MFKSSARLVSDIEFPMDSIEYERQLEEKEKEKPEEDFVKWY